MSKRGPKGQFLPGESGNPETQFHKGGPGGPGRPKNLTSIVAAWREMMPQVVYLPERDPKTQKVRSTTVTDPRTGEPFIWRDYLAFMSFMHARAGRSRPLMEILNRLDGPVKHTLALEGAVATSPMPVKDARRELLKALAQVTAPRPHRKAKGRARKKA